MTQKQFIEIGKSKGWHAVIGRSIFGLPGVKYILTFIGHESFEYQCPASKAQSIMDTINKGE